MFVRRTDPEAMRLNTVGVPVSPDDEVLLVDEDDNVVAPGEVGEFAGGLGGVDDLGHGRLGQVLALGVEDDGGEGNMAVLADLAGAAGTERAGHRAHVGQISNPLEHGDGPGLGRAAKERAGGGVQHYLVRAT